MTIYIALAYLTASYFIGICLVVTLRSGKIASHATTPAASIANNKRAERVSPVDRAELPEPLMPTVTVASNLKQSA